MFYKFLAALLAAIALVALGSMSVWLQVLALGFKTAVALAGILALYILATILWRKYRRPTAKQIAYKP